MRVSQAQTSGSMALPRVDWEVVVEFLEGNPDRPFVSGRLYNGRNMPPYALPGGRIPHVSGIALFPWRQGPQ